jgi:hypothetical protein
MLTVAVTLAVMGHLQLDTQLVQAGMQSAAFFG